MDFPLAIICWRKRQFCLKPDSSSGGRRRPGPKGPSKELIDVIVEFKRRPPVLAVPASHRRLRVPLALGLAIINHGTKTPSLRKLRDSIEKWAESFGEIKPDDPPPKIFEIEDWKIEIILFGGFRADVESNQAIAT